MFGNGNFEIDHIASVRVCRIHSSPHGTVYKMPDLAPSSEECAELEAAATAEEGRFETFEAYYPHFLCGHSEAGTKLLHFVATVMYLADVAAFATDGFRPVVRRRARSFYLRRSRQV